MHSVVPTETTSIGSHWSRSHDPPHWYWELSQVTEPSLHALHMYIIHLGLCKDANRLQLTNFPKMSVLPESLSQLSVQYSELIQP